MLCDNLKSSVKITNCFFLSNLNVFYREEDKHCQFSALDNPKWEIWVMSNEERKGCLYFYLLLFVLVCFFVLSF